MNNRKPKIGIITCGLEPNYGACLQALATQQVLSNAGYDAELMNYSFINKNSYSPLRQKSLRSFVASVLFYRLRKGIDQAFEAFRKKYMHYSPNSLKIVDDFMNVIDGYDCFLVGSDQVWNPYLGIDIGITLLEFYQKGPRKLSYAPSFGIANLPDFFHERYTKALNEFESLSIRETQGGTIIQQLTRREVPVVLDPTMLLDSVHWDKFSEAVDIDFPYVLVYDMWHSGAMMKTAISIARRNRFKVLALSQINLPYKEIKTLQNISPAGFLYLIKNAEYIVTDSFHGTVFSILYHKEFYSHCAGAGAALGNRLSEILSKLNLEDRFIQSNSEISNKKIDYEEVEVKLKKMRTDSIDYLLGAIHDE